MPARWRPTAPRCGRWRWFSRDASAPPRRHQDRREKRDAWAERPASRQVTCIRASSSARNARPTQSSAARARAPRIATTWAPPPTAGVLASNPLASSQGHALGASPAARFTGSAPSAAATVAPPKSQAGSRAPGWTNGSVLSIGLPSRRRLRNLLLRLGKFSPHGCSAPGRIQAGALNRRTWLRRLRAEAGAAGHPRRRHCRIREKGEGGLAAQLPGSGGAPSRCA